MAVLRLGFEPATSGFKSLAHYRYTAKPLRDVISVNKKFELMFTRHAKPYGSSYSQTVTISSHFVTIHSWSVRCSRRLHNRLVDNSKTTTFRGYHSLMPSCAGFLEPRKSRLGLTKSTFNAENCMCSFSMSVSIGFGAICSLNVSHSPKSPKNP